MKDIKFKKILKEDFETFKVDSHWSLEYNKEDNKVFLVYLDETVATIKKDAMNKICDTWRKIR